MNQTVQMPTGLFAMDAKSIAASLTSRETWPQGTASGLRLLEFYLRHAGRGLNPSRKRNLELAKKLVSDHLAQDLRNRARQKIA